MQVKLKSDDDDLNMAIDSIVAIPIERFDLDLVTPKPKCIKRRGQCIPFTFPDAPDQGLNSIEFQQNFSQDFQSGFSTELSIRLDCLQ